MNFVKPPAEKNHLPAVKALNNAFKADPHAVSKLFGYRTDCNEKLADDEFVQCKHEQYGETTVGLIGVVNAVCESITGCKTACMHDESGRLVGFCDFMADPSHEEMKQNLTATIL